jgi:hypothetical protein
MLSPCNKDHEAYKKEDWSNWKLICHVIFLEITTLHNSLFFLIFVASVVKFILLF